MDRYKIYRDYLIEENKKINLTAITDPREIELKHFKDSLSISEYVCGNCLDIGTGAGFPGIVLKINDDSLNMTLIDLVRKKTDFCNRVIEKLELKNIRAIHTRAEDYAKEKREVFDTVTSRAVANLSTLCEYALPFLKIGGKFIAMKGPNAEVEIEEAQKAIETLGGALIDVVPIEIEDQKRLIVIIEKVSKTPKKYPRGQNKALKNPIGI
ncbi:MAG: 16S rRNA (guanine(527)-N(7))-methyltransferase RsmG [Tissierellia bacterium]|nr:16S rRNA (guanine(527)-N(7))-methyltransferase RsmG [Tissierellia bacterium]